MLANMELYFQEKLRRGVLIVVHVSLLLVIAIHLVKFCDCKQGNSKNLVKLTANNFTCLRGDLFLLDCRTCICNPKGLDSILCDVRVCRKRVPCIPFKKFHLKGKHCNCLSNGIHFCSLQDCDHGSGKTPRSCNCKSENYTHLEFFAVEYVTRRKGKHRRG